MTAGRGSRTNRRMTSSSNKQPAVALPGQLALTEFIPLMGLLTALDALSIDAMIPALSQIGHDLHVASANDAQLVVASMFAGMTFGQIFGGPLSDSIGRKPAIYAGLVLYLIGCVIAIFAQTFPVMLAARVLQGFGAAIPVVVSTALVRDLYQGAPMARIMSFMGSVFILVPVVAPLLGQGILLLGHWRWIFVMFFVLGFPASIWFALRQPETLAAADRHPFSPARLLTTFLEVCRSRLAIGFSVAAGLFLGAFFGYLNASQQIFQETYRTGPYFALYYSACAATIGIALFSNGKLVERFGMHRLAMLGCAGIAIIAVLFMPVLLMYSGQPPLWLWMAYLLLTFLGTGLLFGNLNAIVMEPLGHIAGMGSAVSSGLQMLISLPLGTLIGRAYDGTVFPAVAGFALLSSAALAAMWWAEGGRARAIQAPLGETRTHS